MAEPVLEKYVFVPNEAHLTTQESVRINVQIVLENNYKLKVKVVEILSADSNEEEEILGPIIFEALGDLPLIHADVIVISEKPLEIKNVTVVDKPISSQIDALLVVVNHGLSKENVSSTVELIL